MPGNGAGINDLALAFARNKLGRSKLDTPQRPFHINAVNTLDFLRCNIGQRLDLGNACVVDHNVKAAQRGFRMVNSGGNLRTVPNIGNKAGCLAAQCFHFLDDPFQAVLADVHQCYVRTVLGQP